MDARLRGVEFSSSRTPLPALGSRASGYRAAWPRQRAVLGSATWALLAPVHGVGRVRAADGAARVRDRALHRDAGGAARARGADRDPRRRRAFCSSANASRPRDWSGSVSAPRVQPSSCSRRQAPHRAPAIPSATALIALGYVAWAIYTLAAKPLVKQHHSTRAWRSGRSRSRSLRSPQLASDRGHSSRARVRRSLAVRARAALDRARHLAVEPGAAPHARGHDGRADLRAAAGRTHREHAGARRAHGRRSR